MMRILWSPLEGSEHDGEGGREVPLQRVRGVVDRGRCTRRADLGIHALEPRPGEQLATDEIDVQPLGAELPEETEPILPERVAELCLAELQPRAPLDEVHEPVV